MTAPRAIDDAAQRERSRAPYREPITRTGVGRDHPTPARAATKTNGMRPVHKDQ